MVVRIRIKGSYDGLKDEKIRIDPQLLAFYRNLLNLKLLFKNQKKLNLSSVFKWLDISELKMPKLIDLCTMLKEDLFRLTTLKMFCGMQNRKGFTGDIHENFGILDITPKVVDTFV